MTGRNTELRNIVSLLFYEKNGSRAQQEEMKEETSENGSSDLVGHGYICEVISVWFSARFFGLVFVYLAPLLLPPSECDPSWWLCPQPCSSFCSIMLWGALMSGVRMRINSCQLASVTTLPSLMIIGVGEGIVMRRIVSYCTLVGRGGGTG